MIFRYGKKQIDYLSSRDKRLAEAMEAIGPIRREIDPDLFGSVVFIILGQQISGAAQTSLWNRLVELVGPVTPDRLADVNPAELKSCGISMRKAEYIAEFTRMVHSGRLDLDALRKMPDSEVIEQLTAMRGLGVWTAEMLLIFSLGRPDVLSFGDLGIHRGMRMLYRRRTISKEQFERYRRRYSPYGTVASLYLWQIAGGALEGVSDLAAR